MNNVEVLSLEQAERWDEWVYQTEHPDVYWLSGYCALYEANQEGKAQLFVYKDESGFVLYPFLLREVYTLPYLQALRQDSDPKLYDIITPYGYGGPICSLGERQDRVALVSAFAHAFQQYCQQHCIISEFVRFSPFIENEKDYPAVDPIFLRNTISIPIDREVDVIMSRFTAHNRNRLRTSLKANLKYRVVDSSNIETFIAMYHQTMNRKDAQAYYFFPASYFHQMFQTLEDKITILEVYNEEGVVVSTALFIHMGKSVHYHLGASDPAYLHVSPNNAMMYYAAIHFKEQGYSFIHLGGGYAGNDSLYRFKKGFNRDEPCNYYVGMKIRHEYWYRELERRLNLQSTDQVSYFPSYRNPELQVIAQKECEVGV
ncbi:lipid II:glycine glycyltransferase FemX [Paenibacillus sp. GCM10027629]|uniref:lipid II:glycine glycyltransferase FemX n=1 Tax=Paenibacillus sp. GCM10027629 TaxID=3273414 RepID=UPI00363891C9